MVSFCAGLRFIFLEYKISTSVEWLDAMDGVCLKFGSVTTMNFVRVRRIVSIRWSFNYQVYMYYGVSFNGVGLQVRRAAGIVFLGFTLNC